MKLVEFISNLFYLALWAPLEEYVHGRYVCTCAVKSQCQPSLPGDVQHRLMLTRISYTADMSSGAYQVLW